MKKSATVLSATSAILLSACSFGTQKETVSKEVSVPVPTPVNTVAPSQSGSTQSGVVLMKKEYEFPGGKATLEGAITVSADGTIESVQIFNPEGYIEKFAGGVKEVTVGKKAAGLKIDTVSGASLTTGAFNDFLAANFH